MQIQSEAQGEETVIITKKEWEKALAQEREIAYLKHELAQLKRLLYGSKKERFINPDQSQMSLDLAGVEEKTPAEETQQINYERKKKKGKAKRLLLPPHLPREEEILEPEGLPDGAERIGEDVTEILEYRPGKIHVRRMVRPVYKTEEKIISAPLPTLPIPGGNAGPGLLAYILISKFIDHLPFYRIVQMFKREQVKLAESTVNGWYKTTAKLLMPLYEALLRKIHDANYILADETPIPVLSSSKPGSTHKGYHWAYLLSRENIMLFSYSPSRGQQCPSELLSSYQGALQTDGYGVYDQFDRPGITLLACMAHARRKFEQAKDNDRERANHVLGQMQMLYEIERRAKDDGMSNDQRYELRQKEAVRILEKLEAYLKDAYTQVLPKSAIAKAIAYTLKLWPRLIRYTENGEWMIDNNAVENKIRPIALGRKNYMFAGSHEAAQHAAMMYSFFATCKMNDINPFDWLKDTLTQIPDYKVNQLEELLPLKK
ncbi:MAG: IS66 family transposase [Cyclobacteriaceae bacterium]|nr:IS66 family transposase [Cyclobacteriaceae bacterium]